MKSNQSTDGHFPYGGQPSYRDFLMPKELIGLFQQHNEANRETSDPLIVARYFNPAWAQTWYMTEYSADDGIFFCFVTGMPFPEWGTVALSDFIELQLPLWLKIERDLYFDPKPFSEAVPEAERQIN